MDKAALWADGADRWVSVERGFSGNKQNALRARATTVGPWERFWTCYVDNDPGNIALLANEGGMFVSVEWGFSGSDYGLLRARASTVGPWESFYYDFQGDETLSPGPTFGCSVSPELQWGGNDKGLLRARSCGVPAGPWEVFKIVRGAW